MSAHKIGWRVYSLLTTTGEVGSEFDPVSGSWSIELNKIESFSVTVKKADLLRRDKKWWYPWSGGVLFTYTGSDGVERPVVAGPIIDYGTETWDELTLECAGIRKIFEYRTVWLNLAYRSMTYGDIAWDLCVHGMEKPGGRLPIVHGVPAEAGRYERTYEAWNLANNQIDKRWSELSEVINGPDIMIRPRWAVSEFKKIQWVFVHGVSTNTSIPQDWTPDFDTTAAAADVGDVQVASSGKELRHRVWCTGSGEGEGIVRQYAQDLTGVANGMPFMESVLSDSDQDTPEVLQGKAQGALADGSAMLDQVTFDIRADSEKNPWGSFFVGDAAMVTLKGWINIPDGTRSMKIIKANGDLGAKVTLDFQEEVWE